MIDKLKQVIQKANPEIMENKLGCEYIGRNGDKFVTVKYQGNYVWRRLYRHGELQQIIYKEEIKPGFKILGRPITLADVLIAMDKKVKGNSFFVEMNGNFRMWGDRGLVVAPYANWNFLKNNLDDQDEPTLKFLTDLLV